MSVTRLLVLGAVRIHQPAHGYLVRRELISWRAEEWAHLNPGSVYHALRTLTREKLLQESAATAGRGNGPSAKATYRLTQDGEDEFMALLRKALWEIHPYEPAQLSTAISFWHALTREEILQALAARRIRLEAEVPLTRHLIEHVEALPNKPSYVAEHFHMYTHLVRAEIGWIDEVTARITSGAYTFAGEGGPFTKTPPP
jgi:DNA-binding PadR family transcriptional regulator